MKPNPNNSESLLEYIIGIEEKIAIANKAGKPTEDLRRNRTLALQQLNTLQQASPTTKKAFEAVTGQI